MGAPADSPENGHTSRLHERASSLMGKHLTGWPGIRAAVGVVGAAALIVPHSPSTLRGPSPGEHVSGQQRSLA
jgi:hypothetical protein